MECFTVESGFSYGARVSDPQQLHQLSNSDRRCFDAGFCCGSQTSRSVISTFGNSHKCAFTTPAGRWRTRNFPLRSTTNATKPPRGCRLAFAEVGQFLHAIFPEGDAKFFHRTNPALRIARRANQRAEFHQRLVQMRAGIVLTQRREVAKLFSSLACFASLREKPILPPASKAARWFFSPSDFPRCRKCASARG